MTELRDRPSSSHAWRNTRIHAANQALREAEIGPKRRAPEEAEPGYAWGMSPCRSQPRAKHEPPPSIEGGPSFLIAELSSATNAELTHLHEQAELAFPVHGDRPHNPGRKAEHRLAAMEARGKAHRSAELRTSSAKLISVVSLHHRRARAVRIGSGRASDYIGRVWHTTRRNPGRAQARSIFSRDEQHGAELRDSRAQG
ncbi:hypothetical protein Dimus_032113 [Dionaea muscipula]